MRATKTITNPVIEALLGRRSLAPRKQGKLAPDAEELEVIFNCAMTAPDHGNMKPQRFRVLHQHDGGMEHLANLYGRALLAHAKEEGLPPPSEEEVEKDRQRALRGGLVIVISAEIASNPKVPDQEQYGTALLAAHHVLLACESLGYGGMMLTGWRSEHPIVREGLQFSPAEQMVAVLHVGSVAAAAIPVTRIAPTVVPSLPSVTPST